MSMKAIPKSVVAAMVIVGLIIGVSGCSSTQTSPSVTPSVMAFSIAETKSAVTPSPSTKVASPTPPKPKPSSTVVPKLTDVAFTLALETGQQYTENTTPIYLKSSQILHLNWVVAKGSDYFYMTFTLPTGAQIAVRSDGEMANYVPSESTVEKLTKSGSLVICPADNDWTDGYYLLHPQIYKNDAPVTIKLLYWIEG